MLPKLVFVIAAGLSQAMGSGLGLILGIGFLLRGRRHPLNIAVAAVSSSVLFFVLTNFAVWARGVLYPLTSAGLVECYVAAIPFFGNTLAGDLFYSTVLFGSLAIAEARIPGLQAETSLKRA